MKRKLIICSSLITLLLSVFSVPIFAEETVQDSSNLHTLSDGVLLDSYFYDNFDLLPYLESDSENQYLNTGVFPSNHLKVDVTFSYKPYSGGLHYLFGGRDGSNLNALAFGINSFLNDNTDMSYFIFANSYEFFTTHYYEMTMNNLLFDKNEAYLNNSKLYEFTDSDFTSSYPIYIFALNNGGSVTYHGNYKIYKFSIFDYSLNDGDGGYVRYYYPAKSKSSSTLGLYDAVSKTFIASSGSVSFSNPTDEYVENFQISNFLTNSLTWIGQIFTAIIDMPIVIIFMAIGLAGAMFRWGRRIVHF